ncbi:MAG: hypothetical protein DWH82_04740 [Planctomycetota bacterium]|nr:MAG: hypothetical protein DWH82_04740 [Planctomycetota bacterium]
MVLASSIAPVSPRGLLPSDSWPRRSNGPHSSREVRSAPPILQAVRSRLSRALRKPATTLEKLFSSGFLARFSKASSDNQPASRSKSSNHWLTPHSGRKQGCFRFPQPMAGSFPGGKTRCPDGIPPPPIRPALLFFPKKTGQKRIFEAICPPLKCGAGNSPAGFGPPADFDKLVRFL